MTAEGFYWADKRHFINTCCKAIRDKHGERFVTNSVISFMHKLYEWEQEYKDIFLSDGYKLPTSTLVAKFKKANTSDDLIAAINMVHEDWANRNFDAFYFNRGKPVSVSIGNMETVEMSYQEWRALVKETNSRKPDDELTATLKNRPGVYFLYSKTKELLYIGKSTNLATRVYQSAQERKATYLRYIFTNTTADCHIIEPYLVAKLNPPFNGEFKSCDEPSFEIPIPPMSDFIDLTGKIECNEED